MNHRIAYQGEEGCYSESAVFQLFGGNNVNGMPCESFEVAFKSVSKGEATFALMPIENSLGGSIHANYDLLIKYGLHIVAELNFRVRHSIMALPGVQMKDVKKVLSHYQALAQCDGYIRNRKLEPKATYDTAGSAKMIRDQNLKDCAAICSAHAAKIYGLNVLEEGIEDDKTNFTRFLLLSKTSIYPTVDSPKTTTSRCKTSIVLTLPNAPGALYKVLAAFSLRDIDLTKVESRPISATALKDAIEGMDSSWNTKKRETISKNKMKVDMKRSKYQYLFYLDFVGSVNDENVRSALRHVEEMVAAFRVLGSYLADGHLIGPAALLKDKVSSSKKTTTTTTIKNQDTKKIDSEPTTITTKSMRIGIVGFGRFGQFLAETFNRHVGVTVCACSRSDYSTLAAKMGVLFYRSTEDMLRSGVDVLIISVSILSFQKVMSYLPKDLLKVSNPLVCDVLSVKNHAKSTMKSILPEELDILCTHPMFGPDSAAANGNSWRGLPLVYEIVRAKNQDRCERFLSIWQIEGCRMVPMTCEQHDEYAAASQFVTHFTGRMLGELKDRCGLQSTPINTSGFESLLKVMSNTCNDSWDLFVALYKFNPAAQRQMNNMLDAFQRVRDKLQEYSGTSENKPLGLSSNMTRVSPSKTVALNDRCNKLVRGGKDIVNLSVGEPHFQPPSSVLKSLHSAIDEMKLDYTSVRGTVAFREAIAEYTTKSLGHQGVTADHVLTTTGAKFAIWLTMAVLLEPGSEVIVIKPYWTSYPEIVKINGGVPVFVDSDKDTGELPVDNILNAVTSRTKAVIVCNPNNPSGVVYSKKELANLAKQLDSDKRYEDVWIISDEIYERLDFVNEFKSFATLPNMAKRTVTINGFSKGYGMTGLRLGWLTGPKHVISAAATMQSQTTHAPCSLSQEAGISALKTDLKIMTPFYEETKQRRDIVVNTIRSKLTSKQVRFAPPNGALYIFIDVEPILTKGRKIEDLCLFLMEKHGVCVVPGSAFGVDTGLRIAYCKRSLDRLKIGITRFCDGLLAFSSD